MLSYPFRTECQTYHVSLFTPLTNATHINSLQVGKQLRKQWHALFSQWNSSYISFNNQEILSPPYNKIAPYFCTARSLTHTGCWVGTKRMLKQSAGPWGEAWMQQWSGCSTTGWCAASPGKNSAGWRLKSARSISLEETSRFYPPPPIPNYPFFLYFLQSNFPWSNLITNLHFRCTCKW